MKEDVIFAAAAIVHKITNGKTQWFLIRESEDIGWELPKTLAKKGESSVRAAMRMMGEQAGMETKVLEEAGRSGGAAKVKDKLVTQKTLYYLMVSTKDDKVLEFTETAWLEYSQAMRKLSSKRDQSMLREANTILKKLQKETKKKNRPIG